LREKHKEMNLRNETDYLTRTNTSENRVGKLQPSGHPHVSHTLPLFAQRSQYCFIFSIYPPHKRRRPDAAARMLYFV